MPKEYSKKGIRVNGETAYLLKFIREAKKGVFADLNNAKLREYGSKQKFYSGVLDFFKQTKELFENDEICKEFNIRVEHYIVSTGFVEVIKGTSLSELVEGVWGCELIDSDDENSSHIDEIAYTIDNTTKTRAIFEINKGINKDESISVNAKMDDNQRRVSFKNMIYIADGPSDVPAFSVIKKNGGVTFAVYPKDDIIALNQVEQLRMEGRVDFFSVADYSKGTTTYNWLIEKIKFLAQKIKDEEKRKREVINNGPKHLA